MKFKKDILKEIDEKKHPEVTKQYEIIKKGCEEIISIDDLKLQLYSSIKDNNPLKIKFGADPSSSDLHLGHSVVLNKLRQFQDLGHRVIFIIGDYTAMIGDPTGRSATRKPMTEETVKRNSATYQEQVFKILNESKTEVVYNSEWLKNLNLRDIFDITSKITVARILERDDFMKRYKNKTDISLLEFLYPLLQAYDSVELENDIEIGGTDQKFNLLLGRIYQKRFDKKQQIVMTMPLLEGTDGVDKMSKSLDNYIGITESPKDIFGKIMSISDELMFRYYLLLTNRTETWLEGKKNEIKSNNLNPKDLKVLLAEEIVSQYYDSTTAKSVSKNFEKLFSKKDINDSNIPEIIIDKNDRDLINNNEINIVKLIKKIKPEFSNSEIRRLITQGAVKSIEQDKKILDINCRVKISANSIIKVGKKIFAKIKIS